MHRRKTDTLQIIKNYALRFLIRDQNECIVESLIGDVAYVKSEKRKSLSYEKMHEQMFLRKNGPHPMLSKDFREKVLNALFVDTQGCLSAWRFLLSKHFKNAHSKTYMTYLTKAQAHSSFV